MQYQYKRAQSDYTTARKSIARLSAQFGWISKIAVAIGFLLLLAAIWGIELGILDLPAIEIPPIPPSVAPGRPAARLNKSSTRTQAIRMAHHMP